MSFIRGREDQWMESGEIGLLDNALKAVRESSLFRKMGGDLRQLLRKPNRIKVNLRNRQVFALDFAKNIGIRCVSGKAWITIRGIAGDHVLAPGESASFDGGGKAVLIGLEASTHLLIDCS